MSTRPKAAEPILTSEGILSRQPLELFLSQLGASQSAHLRELQAVWKEMEEAISESLKPGFQISPASNLADLKCQRDSLRSHFLAGPLQRLEATQPHRRALLALQTQETKLAELVQTVPRTVQASWKEAALWLGRPPHRSEKLREIALRSAAANSLELLLRRWRGWQDHLIQGMSDSISLLLGLWRDLNLISLSTDLDDLLQRVRLEWQRILARVKQALQAFEDDLTRARDEVANAIWSRLGRSQVQQSDLDQMSHRAHWEAQIRSREGELRLQKASEQAWDALHLEVSNLSAASEAERAELVQELRDLAAWLDHSVSSRSRLSLPPSRGRVVPAQRRLQDLETAVELAAKKLPTSLASLRTRQAKPPRKERWAQIFPEAGLKAVWPSWSEELQSALAANELEQRELLQGAERAREVIRFALELKDEDEGAEVYLDALHNARDLVQYQLSKEQARENLMETRLTSLLPLLFGDYLLRTQTSRSSALAWSAQRLWQRQGSVAGQTLQRSARALARSGWRRGSRLARRFLSSIGFLDQEVTVSAVHRRSYLPEQFLLKGERQLPAIYQRLFRIEPVEDSRFLVGRTRELEALLEARDQWLAGRRVSVLISGQRGSGKTSMLNCVMEEFEGLEVVRGEFSRRLLSPREIQAFLRDLLGLGAEQEVLPALLERRRVIIIEELERTFLRTVGGYEGIRALQLLVAESSSTTLWILAINQVALKLLNPSTGLDQRFSHRIETASVSRADLESAILTRHNLSGLRLRFATRHEGSGRWDRWRQLLLGHREPRELFFRGLASQSRGIYRTALEIWLAHIECVEAGQVYLEPITAPDLSQTFAELDLDDLFSLVAIMQHGSLTPEEHALVFECSQDKSRTQLRELEARDLLEPDPNHSGLRLRPEALPVIKEALFRKNLL